LSLYKKNLLLLVSISFWEKLKRTRRKSEAGFKQKHQERKDRKRKKEENKPCGAIRTPRDPSHKDPSAATVISK